MRRSILTEKLARRGHHLVREYRADPFAATRVREVMTVDVDTLPATLTLHSAAVHFASPAAIHPSSPVADMHNRVLGVVDPPSILRWRREGKRRTTTLQELLHGSNIATAYPDEYLAALADRLLAADVAHLPVISREDASLVGYIGRKDLREYARSYVPKNESGRHFFGIRAGLGKRASPPS